MPQQNAYASENCILQFSRHARRDSDTGVRDDATGSVRDVHRDGPRLRDGDRADARELRDVPLAIPIVVRCGTQDVADGVAEERAACDRAVRPKRRLRRSPRLFDAEAREGIRVRCGRCALGGYGVGGGAGSPGGLRNRTGRRSAQVARGTRAQPGIGVQG